MMSHIEYPAHPESVPEPSVEQNVMSLSHSMDSDKTAMEDGTKDTGPSESMESTKVPPDGGEMLVVGHSNGEVDGENQRVDSGELGTSTGSIEAPHDDAEMLVASQSNGEADGKDQRVDRDGTDLENSSNVESKMEE